MPRNCPYYIRMISGSGQAGLAMGIERLEPVKRLKYGC